MERERRLRVGSRQALFDLPGIATYDSPLANGSYRTTGSSHRTPASSLRPPPGGATPGSSHLAPRSDMQMAHRSAAAQQAAQEDEELRRAVQSMSGGAPAVAQHSGARSQAELEDMELRRAIQVRNVTTFIVHSESSSRIHAYIYVCISIVVVCVFLVYLCLEIGVNYLLSRGITDVD